jgi:hypothetical protein
MKRMGWSWTEYLSLPADYVEPLIAMLNKESRDQERAHRQANRRRR